MIYKAIDRKLKVEQHEPNKNGGELMCSVMVSSSCSNGGTRLVIVKDATIIHIAGILLF
jgi:hypothetical protein